MDICPKCGLPLQACVFEEIAKREKKRTVKTALAKLGFSPDAIEIV